MPDPIHMFISIPVTLSISQVINELQGFSSFKTRKILNLQHYKGFWSRGYFCESIGHISQKTIKKYINNQWSNYKSNSSPP